MYIELIPNRNSPPAVLLRESFREDGKVKKRTLANLSKLPSHVVEGIKMALTGSAVPASSQIPVPVCGTIYGSLFVLNKIAEDLQFGKVFGPSREGQLTKLLVLARIAHQGSRLSTVRWAKDHAVKEVLGIGAFDEDDLYKALDWAAENQDRIENRLFKLYVKKCGQPPTLILYDVTSSYFEGEQNELAAYGYNRDGKKGKKQIVIGLLAAQDGEPLSVQVFKGNTSDPQTVSDQIEKLTKRFEVKEIIFVGDRGMVKAKSKDLLEVDGFKYITAITDPQIRSLIKGKVIQPTLFDKSVIEVESMGKRYIMRRDELTFRKEQHRRQDKLDRLETKVQEANLKLETSNRASLESNLNQLKSWIKKYKLAKFIRLETKEKSIVYTIDQDLKAEDELLDGCYVIETNVGTSTLNAQQAHDHYKDLQKVERDFRSMKTSLLEVRPIFLRNKDRTIGHVFISMLALKITRQMEQSLHETLGTTETGGETIESTLSALSRICLLKYKVADQELTVLPKTDDRQTKILGALKINLAPPTQCTQ
jgi:transposase